MDWYLILPFVVFDVFLVLSYLANGLASFIFLSVASCMCLFLTLI